LHLCSIAAPPGKLEGRSVSSTRRRCRRSSLENPCRTMSATIFRATVNRVEMAEGASIHS